MLLQLTIPIYADMMECEVAESGSFTRVETEIIDKLDVYVTDGRGDAQFKVYSKPLTFIDMLCRS